MPTTDATLQEYLSAELPKLAWIIDHKYADRTRQWPLALYPGERPAAQLSSLDAYSDAQAERLDNAIDVWVALYEANAWDDFQWIPLPGKPAKTVRAAKSRATLWIRNHPEWWPKELRPKM